MLATFKTSTAYSIALASERSPVDTPSAVAGGIRLPTLRIVKRSPGWVDARRSGTTRLSEQVMNSASGFCVSARSRNFSAYCGSSRSRKSTMPMMSLRTHQAPLGGFFGAGSSDRRIGAERGRRRPEPLRVGHTGQRQVFRQGVEPLDRAIEQGLLGTQGGATIVWQRLQKVLDHGAQAPRDLDILRAIEADFAAAQMHEILPVRSPENLAQLAGLVPDGVVVKMPPAGHAQQALQLIDGEHGGRRVVDGLRQRLDGDVDDDAKGEQGILLDGALGAERDRAPQSRLVDRAGAAIEQEEGFAHADEIAHARHEFDDPVRPSRFGEK